MTLQTTNATAQVEQKLSFDAFGKRRAVFRLNNQAVNFNLAATVGITHQGNTGHQQVDHASVVQMGGPPPPTLRHRFIYDSGSRVELEFYWD